MFYDSLHCNYNYKVEFFIGFRIIHIFETVTKINQ